MTPQSDADRTDHRILAQIGEMVAAERELRTALAEGRIDSETERRQLDELEQALDECWDLLRQRRARAEAGEDPDTAAPRSAEDVERYEQ